MPDTENRQTARNPKLEVFDSKDVSNIAREWDFISFEQNSSLTDQNWPSSIQNHFFELVFVVFVYTQTTIEQAHLCRNYSEVPRKNG